MKTIWIDEIEYQIPATWQECTIDQITNGLHLQFFAQSETEPSIKAQFEVGLLQVLLDAVPVDIFYKLDGSQLFTLKELCQWVFTERITFRPFDSFIFEEIEYVLFAENFANTSAIELSMANIYYLNFSKTGNQLLLSELISILCRPVRADLSNFKTSPNWTGDSREVYNSVVASERAKSFQNLPFGLTIAILQYFESEDKKFMDRQNEILGDDNSLTPLFKNGEGWIAMLEDIAETGVHGTFENVCIQNAHTVWGYIRHKTLKNRRDKEEFDKQNAQNEQTFA